MRALGALRNGGCDGVMASGTLLRARHTGRLLRNSSLGGSLLGARNDGTSCYIGGTGGRCGSGIGSCLVLTLDMSSLRLLRLRLVGMLHLLLLFSLLGSDLGMLLVLVLLRIGVAVERVLVQDCS